MDAIAVLPVFFRLAGKRVVLAGGTAPAVWKAELLSAAGAQVDVFASDPCAEMAALAAAPPLGPIRIVPRTWTPDDLGRAAMAIGAIEDAAEAETFRDAAHRAGVPVNVIDDPPLCDFQFGTIVSRSPLVIGISTDGAAPVFGQAIRARIEALLPQGLRRWAQAATDWRPAVQALNLDFRRRRGFWEAFADRALSAVDDSDPADGDFEAFRRAATDPQASNTIPTLTLVSAGPGDPDDVTLRAVRSLQAADVVVHSSDVSPTIVGFARREALKIPIEVGTDVGSAAALVSEYLSPGRHVVWLDHGDPARCAHWAYRDRLIDNIKVAIEKVEGLGMCRSCNPSCPAWAPGKATSDG